MSSSCEYLFNPGVDEHQPQETTHLDALEDEDVLEFHQALPGYSPTPLVSLTGLASKLGIKELWVKDESRRFGLNAFKALGASYAINKLLKAGSGDAGANGRAIFCTATDGNHGRAVAWAAKLFGGRAVVFVPGDIAEARKASIEREGATVIVIDGKYDDAVSTAADEAKANGWQMIQDTSWHGYTRVPAMIMAGYTTILREMEDSLHGHRVPGIDLVFLQAGVGSWAASAAWYYYTRYGNERPKIICVEPEAADCVLESIRKGQRTSTKKEQRTIMAGLNCGTASLLALPFLRRGVDLFMTITDEFAIRAVRALYYPDKADSRIISGESGAAGLGALIALFEDPGLEEARENLDLGENARILIFNTEGNTDPESFRKITADNAS